MVGLPSLEVYNSVFSISENNKKVELYTDNFDEFSVAELIEEVEVILGVGDTKPAHLQDDILGPFF